MRKKAVQQGRSERRGESYSVPYVEPLSDARTPVAVFFRILLEDRFFVERDHQAGHWPTRFIADAMLGRLTRWLRILGYDTAYEKAITDEVLIERALHEDRWVLTRDRCLTLRKLLRGRHTLIASDVVEGQLRQLHTDLKIDLDINRQRDYRCADCNVVLISISPEVAVPFIPPFVAQQYQTFLQCPQCCKVFWPGTHWEHLLTRLTAIRAETVRSG